MSEGAKEENLKSALLALMLAQKPGHMTKLALEKEKSAMTAAIAELKAALEALKAAIQRVNEATAMLEAARVIERSKGEA